MAIGPQTLFAYLNQAWDNAGATQDKIQGNLNREYAQEFHNINEAGFPEDTITKTAITPDPITATANTQPAQVTAPAANQVFTQAGDTQTVSDYKKWASTIPMNKNPKDVDPDKWQQYQDAAKRLNPMSQFNYDDQVQNLQQSLEPDNKSNYVRPDYEYEVSESNVPLNEDMWRDKAARAYANKFGTDFGTAVQRANTSGIYDEDAYLNKVEPYQKEMSDEVMKLLRGVDFKTPDDYRKFMLDTGLMSLVNQLGPYSKNLGHAPETRYDMGPTAIELAKIINE